MARRTVPTPDTCVIYARHSFDRHGDELAVSRQLDECRQFAADRGWRVVEEYVDNDKSATSGKRRPEFDKMLEDHPPRIVCWHTDRLCRVTADLERVITLGVDVHGVTAGHLDLSNPAGRAVARTVTAWATYEGEQKAERQVAKNVQRAQAGRMPTSGGRPFGYRVEGGAFVIHPDEAEHVRWAASQVLDGVSVPTVVADFNRRGISTPMGKCDTCGHRAPADRGMCRHADCTGTVVPNQWRHTTMRVMLTNPRLAGIVHYNGQEYGKDESLAILSDDEHLALVAKFNAPERKRGGRPNKYLLSGIATCSVCGHSVNGTKGTGRTDGPTYKCLKGFHFNRRLSPIDAHVIDVVLTALRHRAQAPWLYAHTPEDADDLVALAAEADTIRAKLDALAQAFAADAIDAQQLSSGSKALRDRMADVDARRAARRSSDVVPELLPDTDVRALWDGMDHDRRRAVIRDLCTPVIAPQGKGVRGFDPSTVTFTWHGSPPPVVVTCSHGAEQRWVLGFTDDGSRRGWEPMPLQFNPITRQVTMEPEHACCRPTDDTLTESARRGVLTIHV